MATTADDIKIEIIDTTTSLARFLVNNIDAVRVEGEELGALFDTLTLDLSAAWDKHDQLLKTEIICEAVKNAA